MDQTVRPSNSMMASERNGSISLADVQVTLPSLAGEVEILRGLDLQIETGEAVGIVGPSGSGKTTLLMVIAGLEAVVGGTVSIAGRNLAQLDEDGLAVNSKLSTARNSRGGLTKSMGKLKTISRSLPSGCSLGSPAPGRRSSRS